MAPSGLTHLMRIVVFLLVIISLMTLILKLTDNTLQSLSEITMHYIHNQNITKEDSSQNIFDYKPKLYHCNNSEINGSQSYIHHKIMHRSYDECICNTSRKLFVLGLPKAGTESLHFLFTNMGCHSTHWDCNKTHGHSICANWTRLRDDNITAKYRTGWIGYLMQLAYDNNRSLLHYIDSKYTIFAEMNIYQFGMNVWPNLIWYSLLFYQYPGSLFILNYRDLDNHIKSIDNWYDIRRDIIRNDIPGLPAGVGKNNEDLKRWMLNHYCNVETFFARYSPDSLLLFDIEKDNITKLEEFLHCDNLTLPHTHNSHVGNKTFHWH